MSGRPRLPAAADRGLAPVQVPLVNAVRPDGVRAAGRIRAGEICPHLSGLRVDLVAVAVEHADQRVIRAGRFDQVNIRCERNGLICP